MQQNSKEGGLNNSSIGNKSVLYQVASTVLKSERVFARYGINDAILQTLKNRNNMMNSNNNNPYASPSPMPTSSPPPFSYPTLNNSNSNLNSNLNNTLANPTANVNTIINCVVNDSFGNNIFTRDLLSYAERCWFSDSTPNTPANIHSRSNSTVTIESTTSLTDANDSKR